MLFKLNLKGFVTGEEEIFYCSKDGRYKDGARHQILSHYVILNKDFYLEKVIQVSTSAAADE